MRLGAAGGKYPLVQMKKRGYTTIIPNRGKEIVMPITLTKNNFNQEVLQDPGPVLVDFWASW